LSKHTYEFREPCNEAIQNIDNLESRVLNGVVGATSSEVAQLIDGLRQYQAFVHDTRELAEQILSVAYASNGIAGFRKSKVFRWGKVEFVQRLEDLALMSRTKGEGDADED